MGSTPNQHWFNNKSTLVQYQINIGSTTNQHWFNTKSTLVQQQINIGLTPNQHWFNTKSTLVQHQINIGSTPNQHWFNNKSTLVQHQINIGSTPNQYWFNNKSTLVQHQINNGSTTNQHWFLTIILIVFTFQTYLIFIIICIELNIESSIFCHNIVLYHYTFFLIFNLYCRKGLYIAQVKYYYAIKLLSNNIIITNMLLCWVTMDQIVCLLLILVSTAMEGQCGEV